ncbi:hypothetical protein C8Q78DRAFT_992909 [Trametes maxima]|nr:hypothetical protein C8Q78DRAFT_992909 [Trametes maxima]
MVPSQVAYEYPLKVFANRECRRLAERREKERQTPKPKRKRHSSGHSESANSDSGGESDRTAIVLNHSGDLDYHPSGAHESSSDCEASETVDSDSLSGVGRRGRPKKKARSGNNPRSGGLNASIYIESQRGCGRAGAIWIRGPQLKNFGLYGIWLGLLGFTLKLED